MHCEGPGAITGLLLSGQATAAITTQGGVLSDLRGQAAGRASSPSANVR